MIKHIKGDLLKLAESGEFDIIAHGCNCFHMMGAGIAGQIAKKYPSAPEVDKLCTKYGDPCKLGTLSTCTGNDDNGLWIVNMYTQFEGGRCPVEILYPSIRSCFKELRIRCLNLDPNAKIGIPMIGSGIAGGDWNKILDIITEEMHNIDLTIVEWG